MLYVIKGTLIFPGRRNTCKKTTKVCASKFTTKARSVTGTFTQAKYRITFFRVPDLMKKKNQKDNPSLKTDLCTLWAKGPRLKKTGYYTVTLSNETLVTSNKETDATDSSIVTDRVMHV